MKLLSTTLALGVAILALSAGAAPPGSTGSQPLPEGIANRPAAARSAGGTCGTCVGGDFDGAPCAYDADCGGSGLCICPICVEVAAEVAWVDDPNMLLEGAITAGQVISARYVFDPGTPDTNGLSTVGDYEHTSSPYGITVQAGSLTFETDPANVDFRVEIVNDSGGPPWDYHLLRSYNNLPLNPDVTVEHISWQLDDPTATALNSTDLLPGPPRLSDWESNFGLNLEGAYVFDPGIVYIVRAHAFSARCATGPECGPCQEPCLAGTPKIYWADEGPGIIQRADLDGSNVETIVSTETTTPRNLAIHHGQSKIYWTDVDSDRIQRADLDGGNVEDLVTGLQNPIGIALDTLAGKMYWVDQTADTISRADLDGTSVEVILTSADGLTFAEAVAVDPLAGKLYWNDRSTRKIYRANLDGTAVEELLTESLGNDFGIALDLTAGKIYWTNAETGAIRRADLDGSNVEDFITGLSFPHGVALDLAAGRIYWSDITTDKIHWANLSDGIAHDLVTGLDIPRGVALAAESCAAFSDGGSGLWSDPASWSGLSVGTYPDDVSSAAGVFVVLPAGADVTLDVTATVPGVTVSEGAVLRVTHPGSVGDLLFSAPGSFLNYGTTLITGPRLVDLVGKTNPNPLIVGPEGVVTLTGGGELLTFDATVGSGPGGQALVDVSGSGSHWLIDGGLDLGTLGPGRIRVGPGGLVETKNPRPMIVGPGGQVSLTNGGILRTGGTVTPGGTSTIGSGPGAAALLTVSGPGSVWELYGPGEIGVDGPGTVTIDSGGLVEKRDPDPMIVGPEGSLNLLPGGAMIAEDLTLSTLAIPLARVPHSSAQPKGGGRSAGAVPLPYGRGSDSWGARTGDGTIVERESARAPDESGFHSARGSLGQPMLDLQDSGQTLVKGDFLMAGDVTTINDSATGMTLQGHFDNQAVMPSLFDWTLGTLTLDGTVEQTFEAAGLDLGPDEEGFETDQDTLFDTALHTNFAIGTLRIGALAAGARAPLPYRRGSVQAAPSSDDTSSGARKSARAQARGSLVRVPDSSAQPKGGGRTSTAATTVRFANDFANSAGTGACAEALYVDTLILEAGVSITLDNVRVYYRTLEDNGATINVIGCGELVEIVTCQPSLPALAILSDAGNGSATRHLAIEVVDPGRDQAIRVTFTDLEPPYDIWNGVQMWVQAPQPRCEHAGTASPPCPGGGSQFQSATLGCSPHYMDWTTVGTVYVHHEGIIPRSSYTVEVIDQACSVNDQNSYSPALNLNTSKLGDCCGNPAADPPNGSAELPDVLAVLQKFANDPSAPIKARLDHAAVGAVENVDHLISLPDVLAPLHGFANLPYSGTPSVSDPCP